MKPLMLGAGHSIMFLYVPVKEMTVIDAYEINHIIRAAEMKSNESECLEQAIFFQGLVLLEYYK